MFPFISPPLSCPILVCNHQCFQIKGLGSPAVECSTPVGKGRWFPLHQKGYEKGGTAAFLATQKAPERFEQVSGQLMWRGDSVCSNREVDICSLPVLSKAGFKLLLP